MIALIGLPGSGKSTVGRQLARRLRLPFFDSDHVIEQRLGYPIRVAFERDGEAAFRDLEEAVLNELTADANAIISTGGGAVLRPSTRQRLRERGQVIYLNAKPEAIHSRLRFDTSRPLLQVDNSLTRLRDLYTAREPLYRQTAHFVVDTGPPSVSTLVGVIVMQLELAGLLPKA